MTSRLLRPVVLLGMFFLAAAQACGSDDDSSGSPAGGGAGGADASTNDSSSAGQGGGTAGSTSTGGAAGTAGGGQGGTAGTAGSAGAGGAPQGGLFKYPHAWTKNVAAEAKSPRSEAIIAALNDLGGWGNGNKLQIDFSIAVMNADGSTPRKTVNGVADYCYGGPDCESVPMQMPIPVVGNAEGSADYVCDRENDDCHILVVESAERKLYELYSATQSGDAFEALGAFVWDLDKQYPESLRGEQCTSADAAGLPITALLPTADEVASGDLGHALRFILPNPRMKAKVYVHPATHAGGPSSTNPDAPPYGVRFRLRADFDETPFSQGGKVILQAMKKYGMILSDGGEIALTFADDKYSTAKWAALGVEAQSFFPLAVSDFEVVDLGPEIDLTYDCVRN